MCLFHPGKGWFKKSSRRLARRKLCPPHASDAWLVLAFASHEAKEDSGLPDRDSLSPGHPACLVLVFASVGQTR